VDRSFLIDVLYETPVERFLEAMAAAWTARRPTART
jgi:hypothetical protein